MRSIRNKQQLAAARLVLNPDTLDEQLDIEDERKYNLKSNFYQLTSKIAVMPFPFVAILLTLIKE